MAYREVTVIEIEEVLRQWIAEVLIHDNYSGLSTTTILAGAVPG
jgi:hypothetical protein